MTESKGKMVQHDLEEVKRIIGGKADLYEACQRNGWYLPKSKCSIITEDYLTRVITGRIFCPNYEEIRLVPCPRAPNKDTMLRDFNKIMVARKQISGIDDGHMPDKT